MNKFSPTSLLSAALLSSVALSAGAGELYTPEASVASSPASTVTRAQVRQAAIAARAGDLNHNDIDLPGEGLAAPADHFSRTRASVRAETLAARANGGLDHDDVDLPNVAHGSTPARGGVASGPLVRTAPGRNTIDY